MISSHLSPRGQLFAFLAFLFFFPPMFVLAVDRWVALVDYVTPTTYWVDFREIRIPDYYVGENPLIENERKVYKTILVDYAAEIVNIETGVEVCSGGGKDVQMQPTPTDIWRGTISRFMGNGCPTGLMPGRYRVEMTLCFHTGSGVRRCITRRSNPFKVS